MYSRGLSLDELADMDRMNCGLEVGVEVMAWLGRLDAPQIKLTFKYLGTTSVLHSTMDEHMVRRQL
jgi:hypothetical protein